MRVIRPILLILPALVFCGCRESEPVLTLGEAEPAVSKDTPGDLPETVGFNEHIQPVLSTNCYQCHGPDPGTRLPESEPLRLDREEDALAPRENGTPVIVAGDAEASLLVDLIRSDDPETMMPPPESHLSLDEREVALLERWIDQGAEYQKHWAFLPVERPELPAAGGDWPANPVDRFIAAGHAEHGLEANPPQDLSRLHRRLAFDLTGLPPGPGETEAFRDAAADDLQAALEDEASRMLATTASAEHFARHWLDAARYADTHGIHIDNYRAIWPYRDWVVRAFERNMPWDEFTIEQIAGDMLPEPTLDQLVATGFHRCLPTTGEGGAIPEEYLAIYAQDRTDTTGAVWLGLTMGCASCHDHKFDPVTMKDTYSFNAFFRNTPMSALDGNDAEHPPNVFVPRMEDRERFAEVKSKIGSVEEALRERRGNARPDFRKWLADATIEPVRDVDSTLSVHLPLDGSDDLIRAEIDGEPREWPAALPFAKGPFGTGRVVSDQPVELGDHASFKRSDRVTYGGFVRVEDRPNGAIIARMNPAEKHRGWDLYLQDGRAAAHVIDSWPDAADKIVSNEPLEPGTWHHVMVTFDGSRSGHQAMALYLDGQRADAELSPGTVGGDIVTDVPLRLGARHGGDAELRGGTVALQDFRFYRRVLPAAEIRDLAESRLLRAVLNTPADQRSQTQLDVLYDYYLSSIDRPTLELRRRLDELKTERDAIREQGSVSLVMREKPDGEPHAHILKRGDYTDKGERVTPATPDALPPMPEDAPRNRLGLARWLVSEDNPLTPRVTMNRLWHHIFGTGIVETVGDFGIMGARPSHPELLDWLAAEFIDSGWDHRHMVKLIVTSATYRQAATVTPEKLEADPENRLLARGPRFRLDGEQIRDLALDASGLLSDTVGGPPVKPYQPEGVWEAVAMRESNTRHYERDSGEALYRRSLYTFWKRTAPHPSMEIFNAPTREVTCVARERTNTPLQAFVTLNDPQFVEASRRLAEHALASRSTGVPPVSKDSAPNGDDTPTNFRPRLDHITRRLLSRTLTPEEIRHVRATYDRALATYRDDPGAAEQLISVGASKPDPSLPEPELAAWTLVASQILNLDEALNK